MTITLPDFTGLDVTTVITIAAALAGVDTIWNILTALARGQFDATKVIQFVQTHVLLKVFPIAAGALLGGYTHIGAVSLLATGALAAYFVDTIASLYADVKPTPAP